MACLVIIQMIKRVVEISQQAHISYRHKQLVIKIGNDDEHTVPIEDLGFLILDHPAITHSSRLFAECVNNLVAVLVCDDKHLPAGMFLPLVGNTTQTAHMQKQTEASSALKQRLWKQIIRAKIEAQHAALERMDKSLPVLKRLVKLVTPGDPKNIEAQAARWYFRTFLGDSFRRRDEANPINAMLNYGYAVVRAACCRALVGAGLHPSLGIHHHNQYDAFCLADDIMEPLRPLVDTAVYSFLQNGKDAALNQEGKTVLLSVLHQNCLFEKQKAPLMILLQDYAASVRRAIVRQDKQIIFPVMV